MTRHEAMEREMHGRTLEMLKINTESIRHDIKNPPKPPINIWTYLPWIAMVLIPYLMERLKSKKDKDLLQNLQNNLSELLKSQKKEKRE